MDSLPDNIVDPVVKCIVKYRNHASINPIRQVCKENKLLFSFWKVDKEEFFKQILKLDSSKACQDTNEPIKVYCIKYARVLVFTGPYSSV